MLPQTIYHNMYVERDHAILALLLPLRYFVDRVIKFLLGLLDRVTEQVDDLNNTDLLSQFTFAIKTLASSIWTCLVFLHNATITPHFSRHNVGRGCKGQEG